MIENSVKMQDFSTKCSDFICVLFPIVYMGLIVKGFLVIPVIFYALRNVYLINE